MVPLRYAHKKERTRPGLNAPHCTEVRFISFLSSGFFTTISTGEETGNTHL